MKTKVILALAAAITGNFAMALEKPDYAVLYKDGKTEYRLYAPYLVAETEVTDTASRTEAANDGFKRLFGYITGANSSQNDIAMTAPVQQTPRGQSISMTAPVQQEPSELGWRIAFMLPSKFTLADAPVPTDSRIHIRKIPGRLMAVIRYSGRWTTKNIDKHEIKLRERLSEDGVTALSKPESAFYNAPFTPPFMRRNEIMLEVASYPGYSGNAQANTP